MHVDQLQQIGAAVDQLQTPPFGAVWGATGYHTEAFYVGMLDLHPARRWEACTRAGGALTLSEFVWTRSMGMALP
jgi:hypothetical protein